MSQNILIELSWDQAQRLFGGGVEKSRRKADKRKIKKLSELVDRLEAARERDAEELADAHKKCAVEDARQRVAFRELNKMHEELKRKHEDLLKSTRDEQQDHQATRSKVSEYRTALRQLVARIDRHVVGPGVPAGLLDAVSTARVLLDTPDKHTTSTPSPIVARSDGMRP